MSHAGIDFPDRCRWQPLGGGSICDVWRASLDGGEQVVIKATPYDPTLEAEGLEALADAGAPVPAVLMIEPSAGPGTSGLLMLEYVSGPADWEGLGSSLAAVHRTTAARFGWPRDNLIGSAPQANGWIADWPTFYAERRIRPHLGAASLPEPVRARLARALDGSLQALLDSDPPPSLVHGDLWSGNVVSGRWFIDPAVHHGDREYELAFAHLFGGLPDAFFQAYEEEWPLPDGADARRPALQLHHLLVHVRLFGAGYVDSVVARLDALGW